MLTCAKGDKPHEKGLTSICAEQFHLTTEGAFANECHHFLLPRRQMALNLIGLILIF